MISSELETLWPEIVDRNSNNLDASASTKEDTDDSDSEKNDHERRFNKGELIRRWLFDAESGIESPPNTRDRLVLLKRSILTTHMENDQGAIEK